jgi:hypothetical protein
VISPQSHFKKPAVEPPAFFEPFSHRKTFIARSRNKAGGTGNRAEHRPSPAVVGAGNA